MGLVALAWSRQRPGLSGLARSAMAGMGPRMPRKRMSPGRVRFGQRVLAGSVLRLSASLMKAGGDRTTSAGH